MRWRGGQESSNVEDRRGMPAGQMVVGGGIGTVVLVVLYMLLGGDPGDILAPQGGGAGMPGGAQVAEPIDPENDPQAELKKFVSVVLHDTELVWHDQFKQMGRTYQDPKLTLFSGRVQSGCGLADAGMGPFYCPADEKVYLDMSFFNELQQKFRAPGEFAQAYVIAHEVGHHVQHQLGITDKVDAQRRRLSEREFNKLSVRLELQADFFAGLWAHHAQKARDILEKGDVEAALNAASAIGDDKLQKQMQGRVVPDLFTHGTSEQRVRWFRKGLASGKFSDGDTFAVDDDEL